MSVEEEASGWFLKVGFYCVSHPQRWDVLDEGYSHNKFDTCEVFRVLSSAAGSQDSFFRFSKASQAL